MTQQTYSKIRFLCTEPSEDGFGFFKYARHLSTEPPNPLRQIFSIIRSYGCDFLVEEQIEPDLECQEELRTLSAIIKKDIRRCIYRISFFKSNAEITFLHDPTARQTQSQFYVDSEKFSQLLDAESADTQPPELLGFLYLVNDFVADDSQEFQHLQSYVHSAVIKTKEDNFKYVHSYADYEIQILGRSLSVRGSYFAQQPGLQERTYCCAHVAIMTALKNIHSLLDISFGCPYEKINETVGIDHKNRIADGGLMPDEISLILNMYGINNEIFTTENIRESLRINEALAAELVIKFAYYAIEAGLPAIICFWTTPTDNEFQDRSGCLPTGLLQRFHDSETMGHAMCVVGHTFDEDKWPGEWGNAYNILKWATKYYHPSHTWVSDLIVQDDNFGPYCTLPVRRLITARPLVILPYFPWTQFDNGAWRAEFHALKFLYNEDESFKEKVYNEAGNNYWLDEFFKQYDSKRLVLRTIPYTSAQYADFLKKNDIIGNERLLDIVKNRFLNEQPFWLVELSIPELYQRNYKKLGELVVRPSRNSRDFQIVLVRLPGLLSLYDGINNLHFRVPGKYHYKIARKGRQPRTKDERYLLYKQFFSSMIS